MAHETEIETLRTFSKKVKRLLDSRFTENVLKKHLKWNWSWKAGEGSVLDYPDCDDDDRDAFLLTLRLLIQNNDLISIANVTRIIDSLPLSEKITDPWTHNRTELNNYLDSNPFFTAFGEPKSYRELIDTLIYGEWSHLDPKYRPAVEKWLGDEFVWSNMQTMFFMVMQNLVSCLSAFRVLAEMAIEQIETGKEP
ncbi:MAG: hypothetical protein GVY36_17355 [Verrucomicrobia bacterium]|nr:hypothetical protein [Verrucomicrobiota bacterium]